MFARINRLAAWTALAPYALAVAIFALFASSDYARREGVLGLAHLTLYFVYVGLYTSLAILLSRQTSTWLRLVLGALGAACMVVVGFLAFYLGFVIGWIFAFTLGFYVSLAVIPAMGVAVGALMTVLIVELGGWPRGNETVVTVRRLNMVTASLAACLAFYFSLKEASGSTLPYGWEHVLSLLAMGLAGPLAHAVAMANAGPSHAPPGSQTQLGRQAYSALAGLMLLALLSLATAVYLTHAWSGGRLWTAQGLADVLQSREQITRGRQPPADQPVAIGAFVIDRRPGDLTDKSYNWRSKRFHEVTFKLGSVASADGPIEVKLEVRTKGGGLAYLCDPPVEGQLSPCRVVHRDPAFKDDPRVIRVGLWQGQSEIGRMSGRQFMISCRYSAGFCKIEFVDPWFDGLAIALLFSPRLPDRWPEVIAFATPQIEKLIRPAP